MKIQCEPKSFYMEDTLKVSRALIGKKLVRITETGERLVMEITETEAYCGISDKASHASTICYNPLLLFILMFSSSLVWPGESLKANFCVIVCQCRKHRV